VKVTHHWTNISCFVIFGSQIAPLQDAALSPLPSGRAVTACSFSKTPVPCFLTCYLLNSQLRSEALSADIGPKVVQPVLVLTNQPTNNYINVRSKADK